VSQHHRSSWSSTDSAKWRKRIAATLPAACVDCGLPVYPEQRWQVGHIIGIAEGGTNTADNLGPSHAKGPGQRACNQIAGGKQGAAVTNAKRRKEAGHVSDEWCVKL